MSNLISTIKENTSKVYQAGYNKCLRDNPPGATPEELEAKYTEGYNSALGVAGEKILELIALQQEYIIEEENK